MQEEIVGHRKIIDYFRLIQRKKRVGSFYLFIGKEGIGKRKVAKFVARLINCPSSLPPCEGCPSCLSILKGQASDIIEVNPTVSLGIEQVREIEKRLYLTNFSLPYKVLIIDDAHKLTLDASNAFLKVLEEPPAKTLIIFITSQPQTILPTIKSRAQKIYFRLSVREVRGFLEKNFAQEDVFISLWGLFEGSLSFLKDKDILIEKIKLLFNSPFSSFSEEERISLKKSIFFLIYFLRDSLLLKAGYPDKILNSSFRSRIETYARNFSLQELLDKIEQLLMVYKSMESVNINLANNLTRAILS